MKDKETIVLYPCPGRGHLIPMVELGKLILTHYPSFSIAVIMSTAPFDSSSSADYIASVSSTTPSMTFHYLSPVSLPNSCSTSPADLPVMLYTLAELNNPNLHQTLSNLTTKPKAIIIDFFCNPSFQVSSSLDIPTYYYYTNGANKLSIVLYYPTIHNNSTKSLKDEDQDLTLEFPGVPSIPIKDVPVGMLDRTTEVYKQFLYLGTQMAKAAGILVNTFDLLEERALNALLEGQCTPGESTPPIYCVGPVVSEKNGKSEHECLNWLDSQPSKSVLFLSFGSMGVFSTKQLKEMANGLERSGVRFLWVVRTPHPNDETRRMLAATVPDPPIEAFLPEGFLQRTKDRGFLVNSWAPQVEVLSHESVGGFVTHCGWNSVLEGVCAGVPMLAWPLYAEQKMNRVFLVEEIKVSLSVTESDDGLVSANELEKQVIELMNSKEGIVVRERVMAMKDGATAAMKDGSGSSRTALAKLVNSFKVSNNIDSV